MVAFGWGCKSRHWCLCLAAVSVVLSFGHRDPDRGVALQLSPHSGFEHTNASQSLPQPRSSPQTSATHGLIQLNASFASQGHRKGYFSETWVTSLAQLTHIAVDYLPKEVLWKSFNKKPIDFTTDMILYVLHAEDMDRYRRLVQLHHHDFDKFKENEVAKRNIIGNKEHLSRFDNRLLLMIREVYPLEVTPERLLSRYFDEDIFYIESLVDEAKHSCFGVREEDRSVSHSKPPILPRMSFAAEQARPAMRLYTELNRSEFDDPEYSDMEEFDDSEYFGLGEKPGNLDEVLSNIDFGDEDED
mmetsp:Transcript_33604/g.53454  ORF Transcript_33604/g.53454 Transcript_33604/m.53454 type:complete len:301 (-) Transcript_33604:48-950(-)